MNWRTLLAIDADKWAASTYAANFPGTRVECGPVASFIGQLPDADVIIGGPPCQPFSDAGENEGESDERDCIPDFIAAVAAKRPRQFLMENVRGLLKARHWPYFCRTIEQLESLGYRVEWKLLDAVSFGVPQFRERVWVWGIRSDIAAKHCWPKPTHAWPPPEPCMFGAALLPGITVRQALGLEFGEPTTARTTYEAKNPKKVRGPSDFIKRQPHGRHDEPMCTLGSQTVPLALRPPSDREIWVDTKQHRTLRPATEPATTVGSDDRRILIEYDHGVATLDNPAPTIKAGGNYDASGKQGGGCPPVIAYRWSDAMLEKHPPADLDAPAATVQAKWFKGGAEGLLAVTKWKRKGELWVRRLTPLECLRLQSGPDDFRWPDTIPKTHAYRVVGNGWASRMGAVFADALHAADPLSRTVIDLFCGGGLGAVGFHGRYWQHTVAESEVA